MNPPTEIYLYRISIAHRLVEIVRNGLLHGSDPTPQTTTKECGGETTRAFESGMRNNDAQPIRSSCRVPGTRPPGTRHRSVSGEARSALLGGACPLLSLVHAALELPNGGAVLGQHGHGAAPARQAVAVDAAEQAPGEGEGGGEGWGEGEGGVRVKVWG